MSKCIIILITKFAGKSGAAPQGINRGERRLTPPQDLQVAALLGRFFQPRLSRDQTRGAYSKCLEFKNSLPFLKILCYYLGLK